MKPMQQEYLEVIAQKSKLNSSNKELLQESLERLLTLLLGGNRDAVNRHLVSLIETICLALDSDSILERRISGDIGETSVELRITRRFDSTFDLMFRVPLPHMNVKDGDRGDK